MKYYAVQKGIQPGVYTSWDECEKQVRGYSGAIFKSFETESEAIDFVSIATTTNNLNLDEVEAIAYVDGSYNERTKEFSYGLVIFHKGETYTDAKKFTTHDLATMRNVAGEIMGAKAAMRYCLANNIKSLALHYDYLGIECWCTGVWAAKKAGTMAYARYYQNIKDKLEVHFVKVKGHSGDKYNDMADRLASKVLFG